MNFKIFDSQLDYWSIDRQLQKMQEYFWSEEFRNNSYKDYYLDQITELENCVAFLQDDLYKLQKYKDGLFDAVASLITHNDISMMMENDGEFDEELKYKYQKGKRNTILRLKKEDMLETIIDIQEFIHRYLALLSAYNVVYGVITELEYHQSVINNQEKLILPETAYL